ncbi:hypothetical protein Acr_00g0045240 [Actinidia rufa]|uniref:Uncharacterized protein n=1 Tax=Actinidia rufa TaxID=165716 RepID=A0A7J0DJ37_9ERIC|nr:hypothetical protein Acr_00g0045240 [Actinidia rufa]
MLSGGGVDAEGKSMDDAATSGDEGVSRHSRDKGEGRQQGERRGEG